MAVIDAFAAGDVNWLDQLHELSQEFPSAADAVVDSATFSTLTEGGGQIFLEGYVRDPAVIEQMESRLRDAQHQVTGSGTQFDERQPEYALAIQGEDRGPAAPPEEAANE